MYGSDSMGTIKIRLPAYSSGYVIPHPNGVYSLYRMTYMAIGVSCVKDFVGAPVSASDIKRTIEELQRDVSLAIIGDYEILACDVNFVDGDDPSCARINAYRAPEFIAVSARPTRELRDLLAHELTHEIQMHLPPHAMGEFWAIVGQTPILAPKRWEELPVERFAEYVSAALWSVPIDVRMPALSVETLVRLRAWALQYVGHDEPAKVVVDGEGTKVVLDVGSTTAYVNDQVVILDVAPVIVNGRTLVPIRFIAESLGATVTYVDGRIAIEA